MKSGFFLLQRGWKEHYVFKDEPYTEREAWADLIEEAGFKPHKRRFRNQVIEVDRGQVGASYRVLSEKWKWGVNRVRGFLATLEQEGMISRKTDTGFLIITICNYEEYQNPLINSDTQSDTVADTHTDTQSDTIRNKGKERKRKESIAIPKKWFQEFWKAYPSKVAKKEAERAFRKVLTASDTPDKLFTEIMAGLVRYKQTDRVKQGTICNPPTWLNGERWNDEYGSTGVSVAQVGRQALLQSWAGTRKLAREAERTGNKSKADYWWGQLGDNKLALEQHEAVHGEVVV